VFFMNTQQQSQRAGPGETPDRPPVPVTRLKAERVQLRFEPEAAGLPAGRLQERLDRMPGWRLVARGKAIARVRHLQDAGTAAAYATYITQLAVRLGQPVAVELAGPRVAVTVRGRLQRGRRGGLTEEALEFARALR
jgi:pterin-4a-carbinolamine dehydratase